MKNTNQMKEYWNLFKLFTWKLFIFLKLNKPNIYLIWTFIFQNNKTAMVYFYFDNNSYSTLLIF